MVTQRPLTILFADTDIAACRPLRVDLRRRGARVDLVDSVPEAMVQAENAPPDLVVLDESFRKSGDHDLLSFFRSSLPRTRFILLHEDTVDAPQASGPDILHSGRKPVSKETLLDVIADAFPGRLEGHLLVTPSHSRILCVDDDRAYLNSLSRFLQRRGYQVFAHTSAQTALEELPRIHPDLAIIDLLMPRMDGLALTRRIHQTWRGQVPIVVLTALDSKESYHRARESGASYCLSKPCKPEDFLNVVDFIAGDLDEAERKLLKNRLVEHVT